MKKLEGVCICGGCSAVFDDVRYTGPCPECGGLISLHIAAKGVVSCAVDSEVLDLLQRTDGLEEALDELETDGYRFDPHADGFARLKPAE